MFVSTFTHKTKKMMSLSLGVVFGSYILNIVAGLSDKTEVVKYITPYTLADVRNVIQDVKINPVMIVVTFVLFAIMAAGTFVQGSSIELTADSPIKEPYIVYVQGGLTYEHAYLAVLHTLETLNFD